MTIIELFCFIGLLVLCVPLIEGQVVRWLKRGEQKPINKGDSGE